MTDIVERLRQGVGSADEIPYAETVMDEAADEIERMRVVSAELYEALDQCVTWLPSGFAPQSQSMALAKANKAMTNFRALEPKP